MKRLFLVLLLPVLLDAQVQNIPNTTFPAVRALMNGNFLWLDAHKADIAHTHAGVYAPLSHVHIFSDVTGLQGALDLKAPLASPTFTGDVTIGTRVLAQGSDGYVDPLLAAKGPLYIPITVSTSGPVTVAAAGFYYNNAAGVLTYNLPTITGGLVGARFCFRNLATRTGAITLQAPASTYVDKDGANGTVAGTIVSGGALGDSACVVAVTTTQYVFYLGAGTWTNN